jgi:hypothetical protein
MNGTRIGTLLVLLFLPSTVSFGQAGGKLTSPLGGTALGGALGGTGLGGTVIGGQSLGGGLGGTGLGGGLGGVLPLDLSGAVEHLEQAKVRLDRAAQAYKLADATYRAGTTGALEKQNAETELRLAESGYREAVRNLSLVRRFDRLSTRVSVELKDATVAQAAQALSQVSQIPIRVDKAVRTDKRLTATAVDARTADILQTIAKELHLQIAPDDEAGIVLKTWPKLAVNGVEREFVDSKSPWSDDWGGFQNPALLTGGYTYPPTTTYGSTTGATYKGSSLRPTYPRSGAPAGGGTGSLTMTSVGSQVVIAEPGRGPRGESGVWLTVYQLRGTQLLRQSSLFHKARAAK